MKKEFKPRLGRNELTVLAVLFSAMAVVVTGIQMGSALFPALSRLMGVPLGAVTLLTSAWAFTGLLSPVLGPPSDRYGHGLFLLLGLGLFTLGSLLSAVAPGFAALLVFQILVGLGYAIFSFSVLAFVGDVFAYQTRARAMGILRVAVSVAALAGVPAAAAIADWTTARGSFGAVGGLGLVVLAVSLALLPRRPQEAAETQDAKAKATFRQTIAEIARQRSAVAGLLTILAWAMIPTGVFVYLAAWLEQTFQLTETQIGLAFSMAGVGALIGNALTSAWADRLGKKRSAVLGLLALSAAAMLLPRSTALATGLAVLIVFVAALEFSFASFSTLMTELAPSGRGTLMSLVSLANGIGTGAVPVVMRSLWESEGYAGVTLVLGAVGLCAAVIVGLFVVEP